MKHLWRMARWLMSRMRSRSDTSRIMLLLGVLSLCTMQARSDEVPPHFRWATSVSSHPLGGLAVDDSGDVYISGRYLYGGATAVFVAKYDRAGNGVWALQDGGDLGWRMGLDNARNVYVL